MVLTHKIVQSRKPGYIADKLKPRQSNRRLRGGAGVLNTPPYKLSLSREGFIYRGSILYNRMDEKIREEKDFVKFKKCSKEWIKKNISVKPKQFFSKIIQRPRNGDAYFCMGTQDNRLSNSPIITQNQITRYFKPIQ